MTRRDLTLGLTGWRLHNTAHSVPAGQGCGHIFWRSLGLMGACRAPSITLCACFCRVRRESACHGAGVAESLVPRNAVFVVWCLGREVCFWPLLPAPGSLHLGGASLRFVSTAPGEAGWSSSSSWPCGPCAALGPQNWPGPVATQAASPRPHRLPIQPTVPHLFNNHSAQQGA